MDNKAKGLSVDILARALKQAHEGRAFILSAMLEKLPEPRAELRDTAPRIETIHIPVDKIRDVIGSGGKVVRGIQEETGANIDIQEDGTIHIAAVEGKAGEAAKAMILGIVKEPEVGEVTEGEVVGIKDFGAFVKLTPGKDGLLHISRVANGRVGKVEDVLSLGDIVKVQVLEVDPKTGKISLDRLDKPDAPEDSAENGREHSHRNNNDRGERDMRPGPQPALEQRPHAAPSPRSLNRALSDCTRNGDTMIKVAVSGCFGRMGSAVIDAVSAADDMEVACGIDPFPKEGASFTVYSSMEEAVAAGGFDVVVDFTQPEPSSRETFAARCPPASIASSARRGSPMRSSPNSPRLRLPGHACSTLRTSRRARCS